MEKKDFEKLMKVCAPIVDEIDELLRNKEISNVQRSFCLSLLLAHVVKHAAKDNKVDRLLKDTVKTMESLIEGGVV